MKANVVHRMSYQQGEQCVLKACLGCAAIFDACCISIKAERSGLVIALAKEAETET